MQRIAGMTVIVKADGVSEALYNGQRDRVVEAVRAAAEAELKKERDRADFQEHVSNRLRAANRRMFQQSWKKSRLKRAGDAVAMNWAYAWGTAFAVWQKFTGAVEWAWIWLWVALYGLKLVEYVGDEE